jgi:hypothetical protein
MLDYRQPKTNIIALRFVVGVVASIAQGYVFQSELRGMQADVLDDTRVV